MSSLLNFESLLFFFGQHFDIDVARDTVEHLPNLDGLCDSVKRSIDDGVPHMGLQLVGYENIDTGLSALAAISNPNAPSMVSFYAESSHRLFGGATLVCVPLAFCSSYFVPHGEYVVYRHTYKRPRVSEAEYASTMQSGSDEEKVKLFLHTRSRDGFETIPGLSYVGISRRPWQQRLTEHIDNAMTKQSKTRLHEAMRQMQGQKVIHVHDISSYGITAAEAREYESKLISASTLWPLGLNMKR